MSILVKMLMILFLGCGAVLLTIVAALSRKVFLGKAISRYKRVGVSLLSGAAVSLLLLGIIFLIGTSDNEYVWTVQRLMTIGALSLIPGIVTAVGSYWQFFVAGKFRNHLQLRLMNKLKRDE